MKQSGGLLILLRLLGVLVLGVIVHLMVLVLVLGVGVEWVVQALVRQCLLVLVLQGVLRPLLLLLLLLVGWVLQRRRLLAVLLELPWAELATWCRVTHEVRGQ